MKVKADNIIVNPVTPLVLGFPKVIHENATNPKSHFKVRDFRYLNKKVGRWNRISNTCHVITAHSLHVDLWAE